MTSSAVQQFRRFASETNPTIQMVLPLAGIVGMLQEGVGHLMREAGLMLMMGIMEEEVGHVVGERHARNPDRQASRWGKEKGYCVIDGQKVPIPRTRVKRWREGDQIKRWVGSGLLVAERRFRKVIGYRDIQTLISSIS